MPDSDKSLLGGVVDRIEGERAGFRNLQKRYGVWGAIAVVVAVALGLLWWNWEDVSKRPGVSWLVGLVVKPAKVEVPQSALRFTAQKVEQAVPLIGDAQPKIGGEPVYCETAKMTLIAAHNQEGKRPILINAIKLHVEPFAPGAAALPPNCEVDTLQTKPFGIVLRHTYIFDVDAGAAVGRFIDNAQPGGAKAVSADNLLRVGQDSESVSLKPDEEPVAWDVYVTLRKGGLYRVWFSADYDAGGPRSGETEKFLLTK